MDSKPEVGDVVRVGSGTVRWRVMHVGLVAVKLISEDSTMQRSEMLSNLEPYE